MKFLNKKAQSRIVREGWVYGRNNAEIRAELRREQFGFCAYSEVYLDETQRKCDIEHFDPRIKDTAQDGYENWYLVESMLNERKYKKLDERFLPIKYPKDIQEGEIIYGNNLFMAADPNNVAVRNLIAFLRINDECVAKPRLNHIETLKQLQRSMDMPDFIEFLSENWTELSYITALEAELEIPDLWEQIRPESAGDE